MIWAVCIPAIALAVREIPVVETSEPSIWQREFSVIWIPIIVIAFLLSYLAVILIRDSRVLFRNKMKELQDLVTKREKQVRAVSESYRKLLADRAQVSVLAGLDEDTRTLYFQTGNKIDSMLIQTAGMRTLLVHCRGLADQARWWKQASLNTALVKMDEAFTFGVQHLTNTRALFHEDAREIYTIPSEYARSMEALLGIVSKEWARLQELARVVTTSVYDQYSRETVSGLLDRIMRLGIHASFFSEHPLIGVDVDEVEFWESLEKLRVSSPLYFLADVGNLEWAEEALEQRLGQIEDVLATLDAELLRSPPVVAIPLIDPEDDPRVTYDRAMQIKMEIKRLLLAGPEQSEGEVRARMASSTVREICWMAEELSELLDLMEGEISEVKNAAESAKSAIDQVSQAHARALVLNPRARDEVEKCARVHVPNWSYVHFDAGLCYLNKASKLYQQAVQAMDISSFLRATRLANEAAECFDRACGLFEIAIERCEELSLLKGEFERKLGELPGIRQNLNQASVRYGGALEFGKINLRSYKPGEPNDYNRLLVLVMMHVRSWEDAVYALRQEWYEESRLRAAEGTDVSSEGDMALAHKMMYEVAEEGSAS